MLCTWYFNSIPVQLNNTNLLNLRKTQHLQGWQVGASFSYLLLLNYIKKASNNDSTLREIFGGPGRTWTYDRTIMSPCTAFYTGFHQVILTNIYSILTLLFTNTKCYWMVLNIMADRHLYGHLNPGSWFLLCRICWLVFLEGVWLWRNRGVYLEGNNGSFFRDGLLFHNWKTNQSIL